MNVEELNNFLRLIYKLKTARKILRKYGIVITKVCNTVTGKDFCILMYKYLLLTQQTEN